jgi:anti-sigma factor RsiW
MRNSDCRYTSLKLNAYIDGELARDAHRMVARHLAGCARCRAHYDEQMALKHELASGLQRITAPSVERRDALWRGIVADLQGTAGVQLPAPYPHRALLGSGLVAALLLILVVPVIAQVSVHDASPVVSRQPVVQTAPLPTDALETTAPQLVLTTGYRMTTEAGTQGAVPTPYPSSRTGLQPVQPNRS